jgi:FkbM family methyltransferase
MNLFQKIKHQLTLLFESEYNKKNSVYALYRFAYWNICKLLKKDFHATLWTYKFKFWITSHQSYWLYKNYYLDTHEFSIIKALTKPGDVIFDIGANIGIYSLWFSKCINDTGLIYSFEPDDTNINRLKYAISLNSLKSIIPNNLALSNTVGEAKFSTGLDEQNSLINGYSPLTDQYRIVHTCTIDQFCADNKIEEINYMKIDVEGAEWFVLNGAENMLANKKIKVIQLEINHQLLKFNIKVDNLHQYMLGFGYNLYRLKSDFISVDLEKENLINEDSNNYYFIAEMEYISGRLIK